MKLIKALKHSGILALMFFAFFACEAQTPVPGIGGMMFPRTTQESSGSYIAVGYGGYAYSTDGENWSYYSINGGYWNYVYKSSDGLFVIAGSITNNGKNVLYSYEPENNNWSEFSSEYAITSAQLRQPFYIYNDTIYACASGTYDVYVSTDYGISWTGQNTSGSGITGIYGIARKDNLFVLVGNDNYYETIVYGYNDNFSSSYNTTERITRYNAYDIAFNGTIFVAAVRVDNGNGLAYSYDGINWTGLGLAVPNISYNYSKNLFEFNDTLFIGLYQNGTYYSVDDGFTWSELDNNLTALFTYGTIMDIK